MAIQPMRQNNALRNEQRWPDDSTQWGRPQRRGDGQPDGSYNGQAAPLIQALGWFSVGLGLAEIAAPGSVARLIGINDAHDTHAVLRVVGLREIASGIGLLTQPQSSGWLQARVGGDVMNLALLVAAQRAPYIQQERVALAMAAVAGVTALDLFANQQLNIQTKGHRQFDWQQANQISISRDADAPAPSVRHERGIHVKKTITVNRSPAEIYQFWHNFENLPRFMNHLESVQVIDERHSHWQAKAPLGMTASWDAEIIDDTPGERISWRSVEGAKVPNAGSVRFKPATGGRGTVVTVEIEYEPPAGVVGATIAKLFGEAPEQQVEHDLRAFKQVMETGEVVRSDASLKGAPIGQRPAQPPKQKE